MYGVLTHNIYIYVLIVIIKIWMFAWSTLKHGTFFGLMAVTVRDTIRTCKKSENQLKHGWLKVKI